MIFTWLCFWDLLVLEAAYKKHQENYLTENLHIVSVLKQPRFPAQERDKINIQGKIFTAMEGACKHGCLQTTAKYEHANLM